jgi:hypothetical protein
MQPVLSDQCSMCEKLQSFSDKSNHWLCSAFPEVPEKYQFGEETCPEQVLQEAYRDGQ